MQAIERLDAMAREALSEYGRELTRGGEQIYPQWAQDVIDVLDALHEAQRQCAALAEDYRELRSNCNVRN